MATYAIIENGKVINTIEAEQDFIDEQGLDAVLVNESTGTPYDGATWNGSVFVRPVVPPQPAFDLKNRIPVE